MSATTNTFLENLRQELEAALSQSAVSLDMIINLYEKFRNIVLGCEKVESEHIETLGHCCLRYIDCIQNYIEKTAGIIPPMNAVKAFVSVVKDISKLESVKDAYLQYITIPIFKKIVEPDIKIWFGRELLRNCNLAVQGIPKDLRHSIVDSNSLHVVNLYKLSRTCFDGEYRDMLMEAIFHMCSELQINTYAHRLFPTSTEFRSELCNNSKDHFITGLRKFLMTVNIETKISLKCEVVELGTIKYSHEDELFIRADFNLLTRNIAILCGKDCSLLDDNKSNNAVFEIIVIDFVNISDVLISWFMEPDFASPRGLVILFNMTAPPSLLFASSEAAKEASQLTLLVYSSYELAELFSSPMIPIQVSRMIQRRKKRKMEERKKTN